MEGLGRPGFESLRRLMGLLLTVIAVQFALNGLSDIGVTRAVR